MALDFPSARASMVQHQLASRGVRDQRVLNAMGRVPREAFIPESLAHEAYARLSAQLPPGTVGLSTGEEEIDPDAPIVCCTVEKAPTRGDLLVLDESH